MSASTRILLPFLTLVAVVLTGLPASALTTSDLIQDPSGSTYGSAAAGSEGIAALNQLRALSGLAAVSEDAAMADGALRHSEYMVRTGTMTHDEDPSSSWYSVQGDLAARQSNLAVHGSGGVTAADMVELLMVSPFHGIAFVDPALSTSGAGLFTDPDAGPFRAGFTINVNGGRSAAPASAFPVVWPGNRSTVDLLSYPGGEYPDPLSACSGYATPSGLPILALFAEDRTVDAATMTDGTGRSVEVCAFDHLDYTNPDGTAQSVGRQALEARNAVVVIPRAPLTAGSRYHVALETSEGTVSWAFDTAGSATPPPSEPVDRLGGTDRVATAIRVSQAAFPVAPTVVLARADAYADALAGAPLAHQVGGPVLLTGPAGLHPDVRSELRRLGALRVILLGGTAALSDQVERDLREAGVLRVDRIGGRDRFEVAAAIAAEVGGDEAFLVEGANPDPARGWPDAVSAGPVAAGRGAAILFVTRDQVPGPTMTALGDRDRVTVVGGPAAVTDRVVDRVRREVPDLERVWGADRYETSVRLAEVALQGAADSERVWLATGRNWPDALTAGPAVAAVGRVLILVDGVDQWGAGATYAWLGNNAPEVDAAVVVGGPAVVTEGVAWAVGSTISTG